jgi:hypothetical protein
MQQPFRGLLKHKASLPGAKLPFRSFSTLLQLPFQPRLAGLSVPPPILSHFHFYRRPLSPHLPMPQAADTSDERCTRRYATTSIEIYLFCFLRRSFTHLRARRVAERYRDDYGVMMMAAALGGVTRFFDGFHSLHSSEIDALIGHRSPITPLSAHDFRQPPRSDAFAILASSLSILYQHFTLLRRCEVSPRIAEVVLAAISPPSPISRELR